MDFIIEKVYGREILDSRDNPTSEVDVSKYYDDIQSINFFTIILIDLIHEIKNNINIFNWRIIS